MNPDFPADHALWRKSSRSLNENAQCVEVALTPHAIGIRDSKDPSGPSLLITATGWSTFIELIKSNGLRT